MSSNSNSKVVDLSPIVPLHIMDFDEQISALESLIQCVTLIEGEWHTIVGLFNENPDFYASIDHSDCPIKESFDEVSFVEWHRSLTYKLKLLKASKIIND